MNDQEFSINGVKLGIDEPYPFIEQAHAVATILKDVLERAELNPRLMVRAADAVETLIGLAGLGLDRMDERIEQHIGGPREVRPKDRTTSSFA